MYVTRGMEEKGHPKRGEWYHTSCVRTQLHYLFSYFCMVPCFICRNLHLRRIVQYIRAIVFIRIFYNNDTAETVTLDVYICL